MALLPQLDGTYITEEGQGGQSTLTEPSTPLLSQEL